MRVLSGAHRVFEVPSSLSVMEVEARVAWIYVEHVELWDSLLTFVGDGVEAGEREARLLKLCAIQLKSAPLT